MKKIKKRGKNTTGVFSHIEASSFIMFFIMFCPLEGHFIIYHFATVNFSLKLFFNIVIVPLHKNM